MLLSKSKLSRRYNSIRKDIHDFVEEDIYPALTNSPFHAAMSIFSACVNQFDDPAEFVSHLGEEESPVQQNQPRYPPRPRPSQHNRSASNVSSSSSIGGNSLNPDEDFSSTSLDKYQTDFTDKILSHALKLKKKCKVLKQQLLETEDKCREEQVSCQRKVLDHQNLCDSIVAQLRQEQIDAKEELDSDKREELEQAQEEVRRLQEQLEQVNPLVVSLSCKLEKAEAELRAAETALSLVLSGSHSAAIVVAKEEESSAGPDADADGKIKVEDEDDEKEGAIKSSDKGEEIDQTEMVRERERQQDSEREKERDSEREREIERQKEREEEKEREKEREKEKEKEKEREKEMEKEREKEREEMTALRTDVVALNMELAAEREKRGTFQKEVIDLQERDKQRERDRRDDISDTDVRV
jgi:hypothetical protein